jgi:putative flippase GtrA
MKIKVPAPSCENPTSTLVRWCKFNLVGAMGIAVQFVALLLMKGVLNLNYLVATAVAVETAVVHNFIWHEQFTWADRTESGRAKCKWRLSLPRLLRFHLGNGAISILGNLALMRLLVGQAHVNYLLANAVAITVCSLANFVVSETWVFTPRTKYTEQSQQVERRWENVRCHPEERIDSRDESLCAVERPAVCPCHDPCRKTVCCWE